VNAGDHYNPFIGRGAPQYLSGTQSVKADPLNALITGADGFIARALIQRVLAEEPELEQLTLLDQRFGLAYADSRVRTITGDIADPAVLRRAMEVGVDLVYHLASVPGGLAETDFELGLRVNLHATQHLLELLRHQAQPPRFVFASTIGVYGVPLPEVIDESTEPAPTLSYGAHKLISEILVTDYSRRGFVDGRSLRLPGIVARPPQPSGMLSAFLSDLIRHLSAGRAFECPVAPEGMTWLMSRTCVVQNLLHAAALPADQAGARRVWLLPILHASIGDIVAAIARVHGQSVHDQVSYQDNPRLRAQFASYPPLRCPRSVAAGFESDGSLENLVQRALDGPD
jgi:D-erythronate 2-dehydrogenase